jgi:DNA repair exonuclease SbcCD ATPase subunit
MNKLRIKSCSAKNFLCFGPEGVKFDFTAMDNVVLIRGDNLDVDPDNEEERRASNGVGKSSIPEIIIYGLYGKTIKHPKKIKVDDVINNQSKKKCEVEVLIDDYRIVRKREPDSLKIWQSAEGIWNKETELSKGSGTQKFIEDKLGYTYEAFSNLFVFTDNNAGMFLECDAANKRKIVENMLFLDIYRDYHENAKNLRNLAKEIVKDKGRTLELALVESENAKRRIKTVEDQEIAWKNAKQNELNSLVAKSTAKQAELASSDIGNAVAKWQRAQEDITAFQAEIPDKEEKLKSFKDALEDTRLKQDKLKTAKAALEVSTRQLKLDLMQTKSVITSNTQMLSDIELRRCQNCNFADDAALERSTQVIEKETAQLELFQNTLLKEQSDLDKYNDNLAKMADIIKIAENRSRDLANDIDTIRKQIINLSRIEKPETSANEKVLEEQLNELKNQITNKSNELSGPSPFVKILEETIKESKLKSKECEDKKIELDDANKDLPYYEFWVKAFGDNGIRKFVIDGIIPALNTRISHWLQFLIDGKITLNFDNQLEETIHRNPPDGDKFVYYAMSGGERRRLNLAVSQAFAHMMMLNSGTYPSLVFLDEVTSNVDPIGVQGIYNMIMELAKERQVFVTTHDHDLLEMLGGCESINLVKKGGFTTIKSTLKN